MKGKLLKNFPYFCTRRTVKLFDCFVMEETDNVLWLRHGGENEKGAGGE